MVFWTHIDFSRNCGWDFRNKNEGQRFRKSLFECRWHLVIRTDDTSVHTIFLECVWNLLSFELNTSPNVIFPPGWVQSHWHSAFRIILSWTPHPAPSVRADCIRYTTHCESVIRTTILLETTGEPIWTEFSSRIFLNSILLNSEVLNLSNSIICNNDNN